MPMIDFTRYRGESFDTLAHKYRITKNDAIAQFAAYRAKGGCNV